MKTHYGLVKIRAILVWKNYQSSQSDLCHMENVDLSGSLVGSFNKREKNLCNLCNGPLGTWQESGTCTLGENKLFSYPLRLTSGYISPYWKQRCQCMTLFCRSLQNKPNPYKVIHHIKRWWWQQWWWQQLESLSVLAVSLWGFIQREDQIVVILFSSIGSLTAGQLWPLYIDLH